MKLYLIGNDGVPVQAIPGSVFDENNIKAVIALDGSDNVFQVSLAQFKAWIAGSETFTDLTVSGTTNLQGLVTFGVPNIESNTTAITAGTTQTQAGATALTTYYNNITTVTTAGDGVKLVTAVAGKAQVVKNSGANMCNVYPFLGDTINGGAANVAIPLPAGCEMLFFPIDATDWKSNTVRLATGKGTAALPAYAFYDQPNMGRYWISSTQEGQSVSGALVGGWNAAGLFTGNIAEQVTDAGVTIDAFLVRNGVGISLPTPAAINTTGPASAAQMLGGVITSTSAAAVAITTPTAAAILALISGGTQGTFFDLTIDNSAGSNTITLTLDGSITAPAGAITGGNTLTITTTHKTGIFRFYFTGATTAVVYRIA